MDVAARIRRFIRETFILAPDEPLPDEASLITEGIVDSTGMLEVIAYLEAEFGIAVDDREAVPDNLETVARITRFVARKRSEPVAA